MTDRANGLFVALEQDIRTDDIEALEGAITMLRGVLSVSRNITDFNSHIASERARRELSEKLWEVLK